MKRWSIAVLVVIVSSGCNGSSAAKDAALDRSIEEDGSTTADLSGSDNSVSDLPPADTTRPDVQAGDGTAAWPPAIPYHTGKVCSLPACDPDGPETTSLSGTWTKTVTTDSQTCAELVKQMRPVMEPGHVETTTELTFLRSGECIYLDKIGGVVGGVIKGDVLITCEVLEVSSGVTPVKENQITFSGDGGSGLGWIYLFDVPIPPANCQGNFSVSYTRQ